ncbi:MAG: SsrA-binding protein SmpB [Myxococcota bacterium]|jgi:SsrA-binding protein|nr:SsrA-binding protein SmpB [Myxococcota bacterium]OQC35508.1 MAG: SsrA-binding protein [Deltaproteobacteria bacterium ADurb.Bin058]HHW96122.1 SsrA-binding protein SmpB [Oligoflexales bacterium]MBP8971579.1 SsrA-binding protein SmpB [Myxococcota bacterium]HOE81443.1 SsrA-binding protein SmpB [Myxococcota bacterium]
MAREGIKIACENRRARHDYELFDKFEAGLVLTGSEVKSLRDGGAALVDSYVEIRENEAFLVGANIARYSNASYMNHEPKRDRKLLLHAREIRRLGIKVREKGLTIIPLKIYFKNGFAKVEIALAKGKRTYDKRHAIQKRDMERAAQRGD